MTKSVLRTTLTSSLGLLALIGATASSHAGQVVGPIGHVIMAGDGFYIQFDYRDPSVVVTHPFAPCAANRRFYIDATSARGKVALAIALAAKTANEKVWVAGSGTCSLDNDAEAINNVANCVSGSPVGSCM